MRLSISSLAIVPIALLFAGCAVGYNSTLFMTKSNIGIDAETKPPTAEISIARREGVIAPGFEGGQTPPVVASFQAHANPFSRFFFGVKSTFAGGDAAVALSQGPGGLKTGEASALCLSEKPDPKKFLWVFDVSIPEKGQVEPFFLAPIRHSGSNSLGQALPGSSQILYALALTERNSLGPRSLAPMPLTAPSLARSRRVPMPSGCRPS